MRAGNIQPSALTSGDFEALFVIDDTTMRASEGPTGARQIFLLHENTLYLCVLTVNSFLSVWPRRLAMAFRGAMIYGISAGGQSTICDQRVGRI